MSATNWLLGTKFLCSMESTKRFIHLSKITGSKLFFIVEAQHADKNTLMRHLAPKQNFVHEVEQD